MSIDAHIVGRSANYSWLREEEGLKRVMKNVLTNLKKAEPHPQLWLFQSSSSRFKMKFASAVSNVSEEE